VLDAELRGALRLELGEMSEIVVEPGGAAAIEPRPEGRFGDCGTLRIGHALVVVREIIWMCGSSQGIIVSSPSHEIACVICNAEFLPGFVPRGYST